MFPIGSVDALLAHHDVDDDEENRSGGRRRIALTSVFGLCGRGTTGRRQTTPLSMLLLWRRWWRYGVGGALSAAASEAPLRVVCFPIIWPITTHGISNAGGDRL